MAPIPQIKKVTVLLLGVSLLLIFALISYQLTRSTAPQSSSAQSANCLAPDGDTCPLNTTPMNDPGCPLTQLKCVASGGATTKSVCKLGIDTAILAEGTQQFLCDSGAMQQIATLGYGYAEILVRGQDGVSPGTAPLANSMYKAAVDSVNSICQAGLVPVIRYYWTNDARFSDGTQQGNFYAAVARQATSCPTVYAACGHNEAESEFPIDKVSGCNTDPAGAICQANKFQADGQWASQCLTAAKAGGASTLKVTSSILNITHPSVADNFNNYKTGAGSALGSFDCLAVNSYTLEGLKTAKTYLEDFYKLPGVPTATPACLFEIGAVRKDSTGANTVGDQALSKTATEEVFAMTSPPIKFAMGFNWMGLNVALASFALPDKGASIVSSICGIHKEPLQVGSGSLCAGSAAAGGSAGGGGASGGSASSSGTAGSSGTTASTSSSSSSSGSAAPTNTAGPLTGVPVVSGGNSPMCDSANVRMNYTGSTFVAPIGFPSTICTANSGTWSFGAFNSAPQIPYVPVFSFAEVTNKPGTSSSYVDEEVGAIYNTLYFGCYQNDVICDVRQVQRAQPVTCGALDINTDSKLNLIDLASPAGSSLIGFASAYGKACVDKGVTYSGCGPKDTDLNGVVNVKDLSWFAKYYNSPTNTNPAACLEIPGLARGN